ncbi:hypothetical protein CI238_11195, partial [Colletotrichum incanum]
LRLKPCDEGWGELSPEPANRPGRRGEDPRFDKMSLLSRCSINRTSFTSTRVQDDTLSGAASEGVDEDCQTAKCIFPHGKEQGLTRHSHIAKEQ